jgi:putative Flp pilus-assembly TadE/G-like protein
VLVLFVLFLLVLLGISALAIDYASWLLVDRGLQNVADHAALAGASEFDQRTQQGTCASGAGQVKCQAARAQAWASINDELSLGLSPEAITVLSNSNSPDVGTTTVTDTNGVIFTWPDRVWVATPPPSYAAYTASSIGGRYAGNFGVVFTRVDRDVRSFVGGALGIRPQPRHGWATAGALPTDFALEVFCRNNVAPESGVCVNSAGLTIDGQGGIRLLRGDVGSNESLTITANTGNGMVLEAGNMFLVNRSCSTSTWNCPNSPPQGGISDGVTGKNAFYMPPLPVPQFASPINANTRSNYDCSTADTTHLCVPHKSQTSGSPGSPGDWTCSTSSNTPVRCGTPIVNTSTSPSTVTCTGAGGGSPPLDYYAISVASGASAILGDAGHLQGNGDEWRNIDDDATAPDPDTAATPADPPTDWVYTPNLDINGGGTRTVTTSFTVNLGQSGPRLAGDSTIKYVAFKTNGGVLTNSGYDVSLTVSLIGGVTSAQADVPRVLTGTPTQYSYDVSSALITDYNSLQLLFTFTETDVNDDTLERGGGVSWAEIHHPDPQPAVPPFIAPGYWRSIDIPAGGCAILDPTAEYSSLLAYQMPGIYRFGGGGSPNTRKIKLGDGSFLIGDGVTLVFDADYPDSGSNQGVAIGANAALVLNTMRVAGSTPPCTPSEASTSTVNQSAPLSSLPYSAVCAAWSIDNSASGIKPGANAWASCDPANLSNPHCVNRASYNPPATYRGVTFYFTPAAWPPSGITNRFEMQGGSGNEAGLAFRGVLYAPYDDVKITGGNGFNTVGQVLAWTAKFNGGSAYIDLDYPYDFTPAAPYLLEPTVDH